MSGNTHLMYFFGFIEHIIKHIMCVLTDGSTAIRRTNQAAREYVIRFKLLVHGKLVTLIFVGDESKYKRFECIHFHGKGIYQRFKRGKNFAHAFFSTLLTI